MQKKCTNCTKEVNWLVHLLVEPSASLEGSNKTSLARPSEGLVWGSLEEGGEHINHAMMQWHSVGRACLHFE